MNLSRALEPMDIGDTLATAATIGDSQMTEVQSFVLCANTRVDISRFR